MISSLSFDSPPESFASSGRADVCSQTAKSGVLAFRDIVLAEFGGTSFGICRPCDKGTASDHHAGSAWDWGMLASDPEQAARVDDLLGLLLSPDAQGNEAALFRRLGLTYIIWNRQIWSTKLGKKWQPYRGPHPHEDHVHFSFSPAGARGETSFWDGWILPAEEPCPDLGGGHTDPPIPPLPGPPPISGGATGTPSRALMVVGFALGAAGGWTGINHLSREINKLSKSRKKKRR